jgi:hypothetical protein
MESLERLDKRWLFGLWMSISEAANLTGAVFDANTQLPFDAREAASRKMVGIGVAKSSAKPTAKGSNPPKKTIKAVPIQIGPN